MKTFEARTLEQWRKWLADHHDSESDVWLVFHKRHTGRTCVEYDDALDEALCFGWIDSLIKRLDDHRYARKFTPRKPDSKWSPSNRKRYARLKESGRLMASGLDRPPSGRSYGPRPALPSTPPRYIKEALRKDLAALRQFERLPPSHQRRYLAWIDFAKRPETKTRRLQQTIRMLTAGKPLGLK